MSYDNFILMPVNIQLKKNTSKINAHLFKKKEWELKIFIGINWSVNGIINA